jgi:hypothetical protein
MLWQRSHVALLGVLCCAWYRPLWHVRQLLTDLLTALACSFCLWQPLHTKFLVTDEECCAGRPPVPLWQLAHLLVATRLPACRMEWQEPQFLKPGLVAWYTWNAVAVAWHDVQATLPACFCGDEWQAPHWVNPGAVPW